MVSAVPPLAFAGYAAIDAVKKVSALQWQGAAASVADLPVDLKSDLKNVLILDLPDIFNSVGYRMAATMMRAWQFGTGLLENKSAKHGRYYPAKLSNFQTSENVNVKVSAAVAHLLHSLPSMQGEAALGDEKWSDLREKIKKILKMKSAKAGAKEWDVTTDNFNERFFNPEIKCGHEVVSELSYFPDEQMSDAMGALGAFTIQRFLRARIRRKADGKIYVAPLYAAVRIRDSYDFTDSTFKDFMSGLILTGRASQYLGSYKDKSTGELVSLTNADFVKFRDEFRPAYNSKRGRRPELVCNDFSIYTDFREIKVEPTAEYQVEPGS
jgi:hypothetical protein